MGFFKDMKGMMDGAAELQKQGLAMQQQFAGAQAGATQPVDLNDPLWAPIHGITLDQYAHSPRRSSARTSAASSRSRPGSRPRA